MWNQIFQVYDVESQSCLHTKALNKSPHAVKKLERNKVCPKGYVSVYSNYVHNGAKAFLNPYLSSKSLYCYKLGDKKMANVISSAFRLKFIKPITREFT